MSQPRPDYQPGPVVERDAEPRTVPDQRTVPDVEATPPGRNDTIRPRAWSSRRDVQIDVAEHDPLRRSPIERLPLAEFAALATIALLTAAAVAVAMALVSRDDA